MATISKIKTESGSMRWVVTYYDINKKRHRPRFDNLKAAQDHKVSVEYKKARFRAGLDERLQTNLKFSDMIDEYLRLIDGQKKDKTIKRERSVFTALQGFIPNIPIRSLSASIIRQYVRYRIDDCKVKPATVNTDLRTLKAFFNTLIVHEYVQVNPILSVKMLTVKDKEPRILTDDEISELLKVIYDENYYELVQMYLHTGARRSEIIPRGNFTWESVDFEKRNIKLVGKFDKVRIVPLDNVAYDILHRRKNIDKHNIPFDFNYDYMFKKIKKYMIAANIPDGMTHDLRRTFGSKLVQEKQDIYLVSKLLGHSSIKVTERHYIHLLDSNLKQVVSKLDDIW